MNHKKTVQNPFAKVVDIADIEKEYSDPQYSDTLFKDIADIFDHYVNQNEVEPRRTTKDFNDGETIVNKDPETLYIDTADKSYIRNKYSGPQDAHKFYDEVNYLRAILEPSEPEEDEDSVDFEEPEKEDFNDEETIEPSDGDPEDEIEDQEDDRQYEGIVRSVKGAYLVSKKKMPDSSYKEVWIYNVGDRVTQDSETRKSILAGTDIDPSTNVSEDGTQQAVITTLGNIQFLTLTGIPD